MKNTLAGTLESLEAILASEEGGLGKRPPLPIGEYAEEHLRFVRKAAKLLDDRRQQELAAGARRALEGLLDAESWALEAAKAAALAADAAGPADDEQSSAARLGRLAERMMREEHVAHEEAEKAVRAFYDSLGGQNRDDDNIGAAVSEGDTSDPDDSPACEMCGGECEPLGALGKTRHFRCRHCGWDTAVEGSAPGRRPVTASEGAPHAESIPAVHLNGTDGTTLADQQRAVRVAAHALLDALSEAAPHGRDFYTKGAGALQAAQAAHREAVSAVQGVLDRASAISRGIYRAMGPKAPV